MTQQDHDINKVKMLINFLNFAENFNEFIWAAKEKSFSIQHESENFVLLMCFYVQATSGIAYERQRIYSYSDKIQSMNPSC